MVVYNLHRARMYSVSGAQFQDPAKQREPSEYVDENENQLYV